MKGLKEKKGFTLIELLAVIVILAIVTVIGATTVLPYIKNARESAFEDEVHYVIEASTNAMNLNSLGSVADADLFGDQNLSSGSSTTGSAAYTGKYGNPATKYCITLEALVDLGLWTKDKSALNNSTGYRGYVIVTPVDNGYSYAVTMTNNNYYVSNANSAGMTVNAGSNSLDGKCPAS